MLTLEPSHLIWSAITLITFAAVCWASLRPRNTTTETGEVLVLYASQTGQAEELARAANLRLNGVRLTCAVVLSLRDVTVVQLQAARHILCVASTTGEGDAPDEARLFERRIMPTQPDLSAQSFAVLALGDRKYEQFAAFGQRLFDWLSACGATALSPCLTADDLDIPTLDSWAAVLRDLGAVDAPQADDLYQPWRLQLRERLNPLGESPLYRLRLVPQTGGLSAWRAGDLAEIITKDGHRRDYSIATLPCEGHIELFVREVTAPDGTPGQGSGLLIHDLGLNECVNLRLKSHPGFHASAGTGPVLLIGAGSGLAGLRAHILQMKNRDCWLIYGERHPVKDAALITDLTAWQTDGTLTSLDLAFSQPDAGDGLYVQDVLSARADDLRNQLNNNGAVMVCGGLAMGRAVEASLRHIMGDDWLDTALTEGRFRRDLY